MIAKAVVNRAPPPIALHGAEDDQLHHAAAEQRQVAELAGQARQPRAEQEEADARQQDGLAAIEVAQLARDSMLRPSTRAEKAMAA
jgi:hypothetical protein